MNGKLLLTVSTASDEEVLEFVNVAVYNSSTQQLLNGGISDAEGKVQVGNLPCDTELDLLIRYMGYKEKKLEKIKIPSSSRRLNLGKVKLTPSAYTLEGVEVKAQKRMVEYSLDKKVVNVEQTLVSEGGTASDVLSNVPSVSVDEDGNVTMKGSSNVTILIDGRPAELSGLGIDQISASTIDQIELITNPSAKYNPEGMSGIINIKTKKRDNKNINGIVNLSTSTANRHSVSANLSAGLGKVTLFTGIDGSFSRRGNDGNNITYSQKTNSQYPQDDLMLEIGERKRRNTGYGGKWNIGADWHIDKQNTLSISGSIDAWGNQRQNLSPNTYTLSYQQDSLDKYPGIYNWISTVGTQTYSDNLWLQGSAILGYKHEFERPGQELTIDATYRYSNSNDHSSIIRNSYYPEFSHLKTEQDNFTLGNRHNFDGQINYVHPFNKQMKLEAGYQGIVRNNQSLEQQGLKLHPLQDTSIDFEYTENIHALYANYIVEVNNFSAQIGGRFEYSNTFASTITESRDTSFPYSKIRFYPAVHLSYKIGKLQELQLSYTRRVNRPRPWNLNPFTDYSNYPTSVTYGNPNLRPEDVHSVELNYSLFVKSTSIYASVYFRYIDDIVRRYAYIDDLTGIQNNTFLNYDKGMNIGFDLAWEQRLFNWWRFSLNGGLYKTITRGGLNAEVNTEGISYQVRFNTTFNIPLDFTVQFSCNYFGPRFNGQTETKSSVGGELALRKSFLKKKIVLGLRVSDLFHTRSFNGVTTGTNFITYNNRRPINSTALYVTFSYKINKGFKPKKQNMMSEGEMEEFN